MKIRPLFVLLFALSGCASASSPADDDAGSPGQASAATNEGHYTGTYVGDDAGPVTMTINGNTVDVVATVSGANYPGSGSVAAGGGVSVGLGAGNGVTVTFEGSFGSGKGSGTWASTVGTKGTWSVAR